MAFYNPQRVVFNPDRMVIQAAGSVGGVLYDTFKQNYDNKLKASQWQQEQDLRKQQMEFNQALQNNLLLQEERDFDYKQQRANVADKQWQMDFDQKVRQNNMQNYLRQQEINAGRANKALEYQKNLLELKKLQNELDAYNAASGLSIDDMLNGESSTSGKNIPTSPAANNISSTNPQNALKTTGRTNDETYNGILTEGEIRFMREVPNIKKEVGFIDTLIDGIESGFDNRQTYSDKFYNQHNKDMRELARIKYGSKVTNKQEEDIERDYGLPSFSVLRDNIPLDKRLEIKREMAASMKEQARQNALENLSKPNIFNNPKLRQNELDKFKHIVNLVDTQQKEYEAWLKGQPNVYTSQPRTKTYIYDDKGVLSENKETSKTKPFNFGDFIQKAAQVHQARKMSTSDANTIMIENQKAYMTNPDPAGNVLIQLENGDYIKSSMDELKRLGVIE